jgi:hypothetical protein
MYPLMCFQTISLTEWFIRRMDARLYVCPDVSSDNSSDWMIKLHTSQEYKCPSSCISCSFRGLC